LLGCFTWKFLAFKAEVNPLSEGAIADLAEFILSCNAASRSIGAGAFLHFGAFFASNTTNTNPHI
jgi:hypothetical protein